MNRRASHEMKMQQITAGIQFCSRKSLDLRKNSVSTNFYDSQGYLSSPSLTDHVKPSDSELIMKLNTVTENDDFATPKHSPRHSLDNNKETDIKSGKRKPRRKLSVPIRLVSKETSYEYYVDRISPSKDLHKSVDDSHRKYSLTDFTTQLSDERNRKFSCNSSCNKNTSITNNTGTDVDENQRKMALYDLRNGVPSAKRNQRSLHKLPRQMSLGMLRSPQFGARYWKVYTNVEDASPLSISEELTTNRKDRLKSFDLGDTRETLPEGFAQLKYIRRNAVCEVSAEERTGLKVYLNLYISKKHLHGILSW